MSRACWMASVSTLTLSIHGKECLGMIMPHSGTLGGEEWTIGWSAFWVVMCGKFVCELDTNGLLMDKNNTQEGFWSFQLGVMSAEDPNKFYQLYADRNFHPAKKSGAVIWGRWGDGSLDCIQDATGVFTLGPWCGVLVLAQVSASCWP